MLSSAAWTRLETTLLGELGLAPSTTMKTLGSLRFMERHGFPLHRPSAKAYASFAAKRTREGATGTAMSHCRKATTRLFLSMGVVPPRLAPARVPRPHIQVLSDDVVHALMQISLPDVDQVELDTLRFAYEFGFYTALRSPSEPVALDLDDFEDATGHLRVYAPKTRRYDVLGSPRRCARTSPGPATKSPAARNARSSSTRSARRAAAASALRARDFACGKPAPARPSRGRTSTTESAIGA